MGMDPVSWAAIIGAVATVATTGASFVKGSDKPKAPPPIAPITDNSAQMAASEKNQRRQAAAATGRSATILTSPLGATDEGAPSKATLLGG